MDILRPDEIRSLRSMSCRSSKPRAELRSVRLRRVGFGFVRPKSRLSLEFEGLSIVRKALSAAFPIDLSRL